MNIRQELDYALSTGEIGIKEVLAAVSCYLEDNEVLAAVSCYLEDNEVSQTLYRLKNPIVAALSREYK